MADTHRTQLELVFKNELGKDVTVTVLDPKDGITAAQATSAANIIIAKNIFSSTGGDLIELTTARIRVLDVTELA